MSVSSVVNSGTGGVFYDASVLSVYNFDRFGDAQSISVKEYNPITQFLSEQEEYGFDNTLNGNRRVYYYGARADNNDNNDG